jgi:hypothetical protein
MTFSPPTLVTLGKYLVAHGAVNLGIVGDTAHQTTGTSYHLGQSQLKVGAYSTTSPRDREPALTEAASAIDIGKVGGTLQGLQKLSNWLARECANRAVDTLDIREVIWSPDGVQVLRWDRENIPPATGSSSHLGHTHVSFYRDSEARDKTALFSRYWEDEVQITAIKGEDWTPTTNAAGGSNGVFRAAPDKSAAIVERVGLNVVIRSIEEIRTSAATDNDWRVTERMGKVLYMLRRDWNPLVPGGDPAVDQQLTDYIAQKAAPVIDCAPLVNAARAEGVTAGLRDGSRAVKDAAVNAAVLLGG